MSQPNRRHAETKPRYHYFCKCRFCVAKNIPLIIPFIYLSLGSQNVWMTWNKKALKIHFCELKCFMEQMSQGWQLRSHITQILPLRIFSWINRRKGLCNHTTFDAGWDIDTHDKSSSLFGIIRMLDLSSSSLFPPPKLLNLCLLRSSSSSFLSYPPLLDHHQHYLNLF